MDKVEKAIIDQIKSALKKYSEYRKKSAHDNLNDLQRSDIIEIITILTSTIERLSPPKSTYIMNLSDIHAHVGRTSYKCILPLIGILRALKSDYEAGYIHSVYELIHADIFSDFLEMADYLLNEGYKDPAAVLAGGVLEEHLRKLCKKNNIDIMKSKDEYKKAETLNAELYKEEVYTRLDNKNVTAWLDLRNDAAHGHYNKYTKNDVNLMLQGIKGFISKLPA